MQKSKFNIHVTYENEPPAGPLGGFELYTIAIGTVLGAGIITMLPAAIGQMGMKAGVWFAIMCIVGFIYVLPYLICASALRFGGGATSIAGALGSPFLGGLYGLGYCLTPFALGVYGTSLANYVTALFPDWNVKIIAVAVLTVFLIMNILGVRWMARIQKYMFVVLAAGLLLFIGFGIPHVNWSAFSVSNPEWSVGTPVLQFSGAMILFSACSYYWPIIAQGRNAADPRRDIPRAGLFTFITIVFLFLAVGIVATGILPYSECTTTLVNVAKYIFPDWLFKLWMFCVPVMLITTTVNGLFTAFEAPISQTAIDGWLPRFLAKTNRFGAHWILLTIFWAMGSLPILLGFSVSAIIANNNLMSFLFECILFITMMNLPKRFPKAWREAKWHVPDWLFRICCIIGMCIKITAMWSTLINITITNIVIVAIMVLCIVCWAIYRAKTNKVEVLVSCWDPTGEVKLDTYSK